MEKWKKIKGYENYYVSNKGRVKRVHKNGNETIHKKRLNVDGYVKVTLTKNSKAKDFRMQRLVAIHFIPNPKNLETVNHINGIKKENEVENLEWMNRREQLLHAYKLGLKKPVAGEKNGNAILTNEEAEIIRGEYVKQSKEKGTVALAKKYNVSPSSIQRIVTNKTYIK